MSASRSTHTCCTCCIARRHARLNTDIRASVTYSHHSIMSQTEQDLDNSQKEGKDSGICGICLGLYKLLRRDGKISKHGPRSNPCPGSYTVPTRSTGFAPMPATAGTKTSLLLPISVNYGKPPASQASTEASDHSPSHPAWTAKISRIPRSARASCRSLLTDITSRIVADPGPHEMSSFILRQ